MKRVELTELLYCKWLSQLTADKPGYSESAAPPSPNIVVCPPSFSLAMNHFISCCLLPVRLMEEILPVEAKAVGTQHTTHVRRSDWLIAFDPPYLALAPAVWQSREVPEFPFFNHKEWVKWLNCLLLDESIQLGFQSWSQLRKDDLRKLHTVTAVCSASNSLTVCLCTDEPDDSRRIRAI